MSRRCGWPRRVAVGALVAVALPDGEPAAGAACGIRRPAPRLVPGAPPWPTPGYPADQSAVTSGFAAAPALVAAVPSAVASGGVPGTGATSSCGARNRI